jgi:hypothetical protein
MKVRRWVSPVILAGGLLVATAGTALAASSGAIPTISAEGVRFARGSYRFDPWPCTSACYLGKYSGFNYYGELNDLENDGHDVFVHAKVDGYGYSTRIYRKIGVGVSLVSQKVYDTNGDPSQRGMVEACTDRGTLIPDSCQAKGWFYR